MREAIYVAIGIPHLICALNSISTLKKYNPKIYVTLLTDQDMAMTPTYVSMIDNLIALANNSDAREYKTSLTEFVTGENCVFIDADTEIHGNLETGFQILQYFDIGLRPHPGPLANGAKGGAKVFDGAYNLENLPHWNSGVIFFRNTKTVDLFFKDWKRTFLKLNSPFDQVSLVEALFRFNGKVAPLDYRWNASTHQAAKNNHILIKHYTSDITAEIQNRLLEVQKSGTTSSANYSSTALEEWIENRRAQRLANGKGITGERTSPKNLVKRRIRKLYSILRFH
jgi:hypothetical protein